MNKLLLLGVLCGGAVTSAVAQGTAFTYQGQLRDSGAAANGLYDLTFSVWTNPSGASQVGGTITNATTGVTNGLFTVTLDFGTSVFNGAPRWLELGVRPAGGGGSFTTLAPRQALTATPYAIAAGSVTGVLPSSALSGTYSSPVTLNNAANNLSGNGAGLSGVNAASLGGVTATGFWRTTGNAGTTPAANFLGTTDNQPLELRAGGQRGLRLQPTAGFGVSVAMGSNTVDAASPVATISGGFGNVIQAGGFYNTIGGGRNNIMENSAQQVVIAGGIENHMGISANSSAIGGGWQNVVQSNSSMAVVAGGWTNSVGPFAQMSSILGGYQNAILARVDYSAIGGGRFNRLMPTNQYATIAGGAFNVIEGGADSTFIGGGFGSTIQAGASSSALGGGGAHVLQASYAFVGGGYNNQIAAQADNSAIGGGTGNFIGTNANSSTIAGGTLNHLEQGANFSTIGGGSSNKGEDNCVYTTIAGGSNNRIQSASDHATIGGGQLNTIAPAAGRSVISGGDGNTAGGVSSAIGGGTLNLIDSGATYATIVGGGGNHIEPGSFGASILGGYSNHVAGNFSGAAGYRAEANHPGTFAWAGGNSVPYQSLFPYSFNVYASNGVSLDFGPQNASAPRGARYVYIGPFNSGQTIVAWNGAHLTDGGIWSNASDKNRKTDFNEVDSQQVLDKLAAMPLRQWRYTNEDAGVKHLGPTAQDFQAAFGLGTDNTSIGTVDADGVALTAIQALNRKVEAKEERIRELEKALDNLKRQVSALAAGRSQ